MFHPAQTHSYNWHYGHPLAERKKSGSKREISPQEFKMLDHKGNEIVEILKEEGTIKKYPPIQHSPPLEPRKIIYSQNYYVEDEDERRDNQQENYDGIKSPEVELEHESVYVTKDNFQSPVQDKENVMLNLNRQVRFVSE